MDSIPDATQHSEAAQHGEAAVPTGGKGAVAAGGDASRHRSHRYPGRQKAVLVRYDDDEFGEITAAAARAGLTPTGFVASVALAVARATGSRTAPAQPPVARRNG